MEDARNSKLRFPEDEAYRCLRVGAIKQYHEKIADRREVDFSDADLRGVDFRQVDAGKLTLRGSYLRDADLRGQDLRQVDMEGCSLYHAKVSGVYFPQNLAPEEIRMSLEFGTRLRTAKQSFIVGPSCCCRHHYAWRQKTRIQLPQ